MHGRIEPTRRHRRWGDNDRHFGPITLAFNEKWRPYTVLIDSGDSEYPGCHLRLQVLGTTLICELPPIIKPWRQWVDTTKYAWSDNPRGGYWDEHPREYGFSLSDGHFHVRLGRQTHDSSTTQDWGCFLPWTQWRQVAHRIYNADGSLAGEVSLSAWEHYRQTLDEAARDKFAIIDFDGERIDVSTYIEEREWRLGTGWFRWLGFIAPKKHCRSLSISFGAEVGPEKGSWKGGTVGHGIDMLPGENSEQAFRRYCEEDHRSKYRTYRVTFAGTR